MLILFFRCDADPSTLAKYVVALAKKDIPENDLRDLCTRELEVFMQDSRCPLFYPVSGCMNSWYEFWDSESALE